MKKYVSYIFGILYGFSCIFGYQASKYGEILFKDLKTYLFIILLSAIAAGFSYLTWDLIRERALKKKADIALVEMTDTVNEFTQKTGKYTLIFSSVTIWICYFVVFLGVYPGFFVYDAEYELTETIIRAFDTQHPLLHVLSMGGIIQAVHKLTGDYNTAIAAFILFQMTIVAIALGYLVKRFSESGAKRTHVILFTLYLGIFPVIVMYALCSSKDILFGIFMLLTVIFVRDYIKGKTAFSQKGINKVKIALIAASSLMMLLRSNGVYAFVIFAVICCLVLYETGVNERPLALYFGIAVVIYLIVNGIFSFALKPADIGHREILTVPIQQISRLYAYDNESLTDEEKEKIESYIPKEALLRYTPKCSDLVKIDFDENAYLEDSAGFYKLYLRLFLKHPAAYINAFIMTGYGMWYPNAIIDGYAGREVNTFIYGKSSYFGYETEPPGIRISKIPAIDSFYRWISLDATIQKIPLLSLIFKPGFMLWLMLYMIGFLWYVGRFRYALPYLLPVFAVFTCFLGPMSLVRYAFYLWIFVPMLFMDIMEKI